MGLECRNVASSDLGRPAFVDARSFGFGNAFYLAFLAKIGFKFGKHAEHVEECLARRSSCINGLLYCLKRYAFRFEHANYVLEIADAACEPVNPRHHKCVACPEEIDVATAIDRFEQAVAWPVEAVERKWAGLRTFAPDRRMKFGFDPLADGFFWCVGQGGMGIQTAPAAALLCASLIRRASWPDALAGIDAADFAPR